LSRSVVYLQLSCLDAFIAELRSRSLVEVRRSEWRRIQDIYEIRKARFTAYDPKNSVIIRYDVIYWRGIYVPSDSPAGKEYGEKVRQAYEEIVLPIEEKVRSVARVEDGEYHNGMTGW